MKNDGRCAYGQTARSAFFRGVEPGSVREADRQGSTALAARGASRHAEHARDPARLSGGSKDPQLQGGLKTALYNVFRYSSNAARSASVKTCGSPPPRGRYGPCPVLRLPGFDVSNSVAPGVCSVVKPTFFGS